MNIGERLNRKGDKINFYYHHVKGILLNDYGTYTTRTPPVIVKKLSEMNLVYPHADEDNS